MRLTADERTEGADITADYWIPKESGSASRADLFLYPTDEIKVVNGFLQKDWKYNRGDTSGTLPVEIFHTWTATPNQYYPYAGWALALFNPEALTRKKREWNERTGYRYNVPEKVVRPGTLDYFLYHGIPLQEQSFAVIAFEDIERLKDRITNCLPFEWSLNSWTGIPPLSEAEYWNQYIIIEDHGYCRRWDPEKGGMIQNNWHIPLRTLADIATFTLIGADPDKGHRDAQIEELTRTRYGYIQRQANGRRITI